MFAAPALPNAPLSINSVMTARSSARTRCSTPVLAPASVPNIAPAVVAANGADATARAPPTAASIVAIAATVRA
jgi:hypothetical protein